MTTDEMLTFWGKVAPADENGCERWTGYINPQTGYGQHSIRKASRPAWGGQRTVTAPVVACTLAHGQRPEGMVVLHSCDNRWCCNPHHLRWGTQTENNREAWGRGRQADGERHHAARITDAQVAEVVGRAKAGERVLALASEYGIDPSNLYSWMRGEGRGRAVQSERKAVT